MWMRLAWHCCTYPYSILMHCSGPGLDMVEITISATHTLCAHPQLHPHRSLPQWTFATQPFDIDRVLLARASHVHTCSHTWCCGEGEGHTHRPPPYTASPPHPHHPPPQTNMLTQLDRTVLSYARPLGVSGFADWVGCTPTRYLTHTHAHLQALTQTASAAYTCTISAAEGDKAQSPCRHCWP